MEFLNSPSTNFYNNASFYFLSLPYIITSGHSSSTQSVQAGLLWWTLHNSDILFPIMTFIISTTGLLSTWWYEITSRSDKDVTHDKAKANCRSDFTKTPKMCVIPIQMEGLSAGHTSCQGGSHSYLLVSSLFLPCCRAGGLHLNVQLLPCVVPNGQADDANGTAGIPQSTGTQAIGAAVTHFPLAHSARSVSPSRRYLSVRTLSNIYTLSHLRNLL